MSLLGIVDLFRGRPQHPIGADGQMALSDHLRELRARVLKAALIMLIGFIVALFFFDQLFTLVDRPYQEARDTLGAGRTIATTEGVAGGFMLYLKLCGLAALIGTAPFWLYQIWAFIVPGLLPNERRWATIFVAVATPLFLGGVVLGYFTLPKGVAILINFTPHGLTNLTEFNDYLSFFSRTLLVFGIAFLIPVFVVMLNRVGIVKGTSLARFRPWIIIGTFVFAAAATPSTDPFTMTFMAVPMVVLFLLSEVIARVHDRRKRAAHPFAGLDPDQPSAL